MGKLDETNEALREESPLNSKVFNNKWGFILWAGGGVLSLFPLLFAVLQVHILKNCVYEGIIQSFLSGGELIWIAAVFLITNMGSLFADFFDLSKGSNISMKRIVFFSSGFFVFLICFATYFVRKGQIVPPPKTSMEILSGILLGLSLVISIVLFFHKTGRES